MPERASILIVDDEADLLEIMSKRLARRGYDVRTAPTCAVALAEMSAEAADVVILDVMLPDRDGIQCLSEIKHAWPDAIVVLLTGHASMRTGVESLKLGADDYCLKPVDTEELVEVIEIARRGKSE